MIAPLLAAGILLAYAAALRWLLRGEDRRVLLALAALTALALGLRLLWMHDYPSGWNEDEPKALWSAILYLRGGRLLGEDATDVPALLGILFEAQIAEILGPTRWAIRGYSLFCSVLAVPAGFAAARSLGMRPTAGLVAAALLAVLPWSLFYGRVHQSGEMVFHELLLVNALARFLRRRGGLAELGIGALGLCLLFYAYFSGRALLGLTLLTAVLAPGVRSRALCLGVALLALAGWTPYALWSGSRHVLVGLSAQRTQVGLADAPTATLAAKTVQALHALVEPVAYDQWLTVSTAAMHPMLVLAAALIGSIAGGTRRALFLWAGFLGGLAPAVLGDSPLPSARRMLMAMPFVALAAAGAFDWSRAPRLRNGLAAAFVAIVAAQSVSFYFSPSFWRPQSAFVFDADKTAVVEAVPMPPHPRLVYDDGLAWHFAPRRLYGGPIEPLTVENWYPPNGEERIYVFQPANGMLSYFYQGVLGSDRVERFGRAFLARVPSADWSWLRRHGWTYEARCGDTVRRGQVPLLFHVETSFAGDTCRDGSLHVWRGRWLGPAEEVRFAFDGDAQVATPHGILTLNQYEGIAEPSGRFHRSGVFAVSPGDEIEVRLHVRPGEEVFAALYRLFPAPERLPRFEWVEPLPAA